MVEDNIREPADEIGALISEYIKDFDVTEQERILGVAQGMAIMRGLQEKNGPVGRWPGGGDDVTSPEYNDLLVELTDLQIRTTHLEERVEHLECEIAQVGDKTRDEIVNGILNALSAKRDRRDGKKIMRLLEKERKRRE